MNEQLRQQEPPRKPTTRPLKPSTNPLHRTRLSNLKAILKGRFKGKSVALARAIGRTPTVVWQWTKRYRAIGEDSARLIEKKLGLSAGTLDKPKGGAFERTTVLTAQLGPGSALTVVLVPLITSAQATGSSAERRKAMALANEFLPLPMMETSVDDLPRNAYALRVDFKTMTPLMLEGVDEIAVDPDDKDIADGRIYHLKLKSTGASVVRVAVRRDSLGFAFMCPTNIPPHPEPALAPAEVIVLGRVVRIVRSV